MDGDCNKWSGGMERGEGLIFVILGEFVRRIFSEERTDAMGF